MTRWRKVARDTYSGKFTRRLELRRAADYGDPPLKALVLTKLKSPLQLEERPDLEPGAGAGVVWTSSDSDGNEQARIELTRYDRGIIPGVRTKALSSYLARKELQTELKARGDLPGRPRLVDTTKVGTVNTRGIRWNEPVAAGLRYREMHFFVYSNWMLIASLDSHDEWYDSQNMDEVLPGFLGPIDLPGAGIMQDQEKWYIETYAWSGPLKYNLWFSIGSSLAFILAMKLHLFITLS